MEQRRFTMRFAGQVIELEGREPAEPIWLDLTPEQVIEVKAQVDFAHRNLRYLTQAWDKKFICDLKAKLDEDPSRISLRQREEISRIAKLAEPKAGDPRKIAVVQTATITLIEEVRRIERKQAELQKLLSLAQDRLVQAFVDTRRHIDEVTGGLEVDDFAETLLMAQWALPTIKLKHLFYLFGVDSGTLSTIPQHYLKQIHSGVYCRICHCEIMLGPRRGDGRGEFRAEICSTCHIKQNGGPLVQEDGTVHVYRKGEVVETHESTKALEESAFRKRRRLNDKRVDFDITGKARQQELDSMSYANYLKSPEWLEIRRRVLSDGGHKCRVCCTRKRKLDVHHNNYPIRGTETSNDLVVLCAPCHKLYHDNMPIPSGRKGPTAIIY